MIYAKHNTATADVYFKKSIFFNGIIGNINNIEKINIQKRLSVNQGLSSFTDSEVNNNKFQNFTEIIEERLRARAGNPVFKINKN